MKELVTTKKFTRYVIQTRPAGRAVREWGDWYREEDDHCIDLQDAIEGMLSLRLRNKHLEYKVIKRKYTIEESEITE